MAYIIKISILLFSIVSYAHTRNTKSFPKPLQYNTRKVNNLPDDHSNCFCYPQGQLPSVHDLLDSQNTGQERIVVYLYKTSGSSEIKMYTPNSDKQLLIPDLPYDAGDGLVLVTTENIATLFHSNPNKIRIYNNHFEKLKPSGPEYSPIGLHVGAIEHIYPNENENILHYSPNSYDNNNQYEYNIDVVPTVENGNINEHHEGYDIENSGIIEQGWSQHNNNYYPNNNGHSNGGLSPNIDGPHEIVFSFQNNDGSYQTSGVNELDVSNSVSQHQYVNFNIWFTNQLLRFHDYKLPDDIKFIDKHVLRVLVQKTLYESNIVVDSEGVLRYSNGVALDMANLELRPLFIGQSFQYDALHISSGKITLPKHLPYLEGILVTLLQPPQVLGIIPLGKTYLPQTSYPYQLACNSSENSCNQNINGHSAYSTETRGPYAYSYKKTYSVSSGPSSAYVNLNSYSEPSSSYSYSIVHENPQLSGNGDQYLGSAAVNELSVPYTSGSNEFYAGANDRRKLSDIKIEHHYEAPKLKNKKPTTEKSGDANADTTTEFLTNLNSTESGRRFSLSSLKGVMKSLLYLLGESRRDGGANATGDVNILNESENPKDGGGPDFRIIGGNAATGSGTPLSNKGRSGNMEYSR